MGTMRDTLTEGGEGAITRVKRVARSLPILSADKRQENGAVLDEEQSLFLAGEQVTNFDDDVDDSPENDLALNVDHIFEADQCDAFDSDVDEAPNVQTMFMVNLSSEDPIYDEAGPSHDSNTPFEVQDHDTFVDHMDEYHEVHEMQNDVQHNYVVDSNAEYTSDSNIIPYNQYLEDNEENGVQSNVSSVQNDALMSIIICKCMKRDCPPDYSKENLLATFAPQRNLTPEQIFWSIDENDRKKAETSVPKPLSALTVYPPNTSVKLVPRVLPTKNKQCAEIVKKNLLIENENLVANCLSNKLLYDVEKLRFLDLEAEMSHNESNHISKLEREYLNLQLKYQHLQESFDNNKSQTSQEAPDFNSFFKIKNLEHQIQEKDNVIRDLKVLVSNVNDRSCEPYNDKDVTDLLEQNESLRAEIEKVKQHYKEMFESIKITRTSTNENTSSLLTQIEDLKAQLEGNLKVATRSSVKPKVLAPGMYAIDVKPIPHPLKNNRSAHLTYINHLKEIIKIAREIGMR
ncbi:hypothetical protein Tco_0488387 [Tanacetum coccineum]